MKKLIALALILMTLSVSAMAQHGHGYRHGHGPWVRGYGSGWGWGVPAVIGGLLVYEAVKQPTYVQQPVYVQQQPVIVQQQPTYTTSSNPSNPTCTPWTEVQSSDGTITRTRTCTQ